MKNIILSFLFSMGIIPFAQGSEPVFSIMGNAIHTKAHFVDPQYEEGPGYSLKDPILVQVGDVSYMVKTGRFTGWDNEPGDFDVIGFFKNNQEVLLFKERDGILKFKNSQFNLPNYTFATGLYASLADNDYFIQIPLSATSKALIFLGMPYGTDLPKLMIFVLTPTDVKMVYYKQAEVNHIEKQAGRFSMEIQSTFPEPDVVPTTHTIWLENGLLMYKDN